MFDKIVDSQNAEAQKDFTGGGTGLLETNVYSAEIKQAYLGEAASGAISVTFTFDLEGTPFTKTLYVTNKEKKTFYVKDGKEYRLAGFITADNIAMLTAEQGLLTLDHEPRVIKKWDNTAKAEVNTTVPMLLPLHGKKVELAIVKQIVNKSVLNPATGKYDNTNETREENEIVQVFYAEDGRTVVEIQAGKTEAAVKPAWIERNAGKVINKFKEVKGAPVAGSPTPTATPAPKTSLFAK